MDERTCEVCGAIFTPPPDAIYWRYCSTDCWREATEARDHELAERWRQTGRREARLEMQAELDSQQVDLERAQRRITDLEVRLAHATGGRRELAGEVAEALSAMAAALRMTGTVEVNVTTAANGSSN